MDSFIYERENSMEFGEYSNLTWFSNFSIMIKNASTQLRNFSPRQSNGLLDLAETLDTYYVPILIALGVIFNVTLVVTIRKTDLKKVPACFCFMSLGIIDTLYLIAMWIPWMSKKTIDIYNTRGFCQLTYYMNILTAFLSSWYVVIILVERFFTTYDHKRASKLFSTLRTKCYVTIFSIFSLVAHLYLTWTSGVYTFNNTQHCMVIFEHWEDITIMRKIDIVFSFILPVTMCFAISTAIIFAITFGWGKNSDSETKSQLQGKRVILKLSENDSDTSRKCSTVLDISEQDKKRKIRETSNSRQLTITCLILAFVYVLLTAPHNILKTKITFSENEYDVTVHESMYLQILEKIYALNYAYKAAVYFIFLPEVRYKFVHLVIKSGKVLLRRQTQEKTQSTVL
ncbi:7 transmembrane receptor (rhodopsin) [Mactra antiquata]